MISRSSIWGTISAVGIGAALIGAWVWYFGRGDSMKDIVKDTAKKVAEKVYKALPFYRKWWGKLLIAVTIIGAVGAGAWYFLRGKPEDDNLYQLGWLGMAAPAGKETDRKYLAGLMAKKRYEAKTDMTKHGIKTAAGLPVKHVSMQFGQSGRGYYAN